MIRSRNEIVFDISNRDNTTLCLSGPLERLRGYYGNPEGLGFLAFQIPLTISCITVFLGCSSDHTNGQAAIKEAGVV